VKIALSSYSLRNHINRDIPILDFPQYARDTFGIDALEIIQRDIPKGDTNNVDQLKAALENAGVTLVSMPIDVGTISQPDAARRDHDLRLIEIWIENAAALGCPITRVNSGNGDLEIAIESYQRLIEFAAPLGVTIAMENHGGLSARRDTAEQLLNRLPGLATAPDWGNFAESERYDFLAAMAPRAKIVHAKTLDFAEDGSMPAFDVARCADIVNRSGFTGYYSIEFEGQGDQIASVHQSLALLKQIAEDLSIGG
jgi:sugar phosphate isomerase/epimerase